MNFKEEFEKEFPQPVNNGDVNFETYWREKNAWEKKYVEWLENTLGKALDGKCKKAYKGRAIVRSRNDGMQWRYEGSELPIIGVYMRYKNGSGFGVFPDGTREFRLSLEGTIHQEETGYKDTVIPETDLEILELYEGLLDS